MLVVAGRFVLSSRRSSFSCHRSLDWLLNCWLFSISFSWVFRFCVFLELRKILNLGSTYSVTRFLFSRSFVRHIAASTKVKNFVRHLKNLIFFSKRRKATWEYRRDHADNHSSGESGHMWKKNWFASQYALIFGPHFASQWQWEEANRPKFFLIPSQYNLKPRDLLNIKCKNTKLP